MYPRHGTLWRAAAAMALALVVCAAHAARRPDDRAPRLKFLDSLFYAGRYDTLRVLLPAVIRAAEARGDSAALGRLVFHRGRVEITLGHQALASRELDRAIRLTEAARDTVALTSALQFKAFVLRDSRRYDEAMALFERQLDLSRRAHVIVGEANATFNLAYRDLRRGELASARTGYERALELFRRTGDPYQLAVGTNAMAGLFHTLGETDSSRRWHHETLRIARKHRYPIHELWGLHNLGWLEGNAGNYEMSLECYRAALAIGRRIGFDRGIALSTMNLALAYSYMGERERAFALLDESLRVCERAGFKDLEVNTTLAAADLNMEGGRTNRATTLYRRLLGQDFIFEARRRAEAACGLAMALADMDSVRQAIAVLEPYVSPRAQVSSFAQQPYFELAYADLLRREGRCGEALERVVTLRDELDRTGRTDLGVYVRLMESSCRRELGDPARAAGALASALDSLEVARSEVGRPDIREAYGRRVMNDVIESCRVMLEYPPTTPRAERVRVFYDTLQRFKTRTLLERIRDPRGDNAMPFELALAQPVSVSRLQAEILRPGEVLLDFFTGRDETHLFVVSPDSCRLVSLPGWRTGFGEQVALYTELLSAPARHTRDYYPPERLVSAQESLGRIVLAPVNDMLTSAQRIIVAADGVYASIPFGTLIPEDDGETLLEARDVVEVPSASILAWARSRSARAGKGGASLLAVTDGPNSALHGASGEVLALKRRYASVTLVALSPGVLDTLSQSAHAGGILHIATHARVNDDSPWQSGFMLETPTDSVSSRGAVPPHETVMHASEIARAKLPYDVAVLAACETAAGRATTGEGVIGLTSAFISAGVPVVISSRWPIDDRATATLMHHFYDHLARGETVASSLRAAQLAVRSDKRTSHPFYWAGFAVVGDGTRVIPLVLVGSRPGLWVTGIAGAVLAIGLAGWTVRRRRAAPAG